MNSFQSDCPSQSSIFNGIKGRWTENEHQRFLQGLTIHGKDWNKLEKFMKTRSNAQIRSHAQKFFKKIAQEYKKRVFFETQDTHKKKFKHVNNINFMENENLKQREFKSEKMELLISMEKIKKNVEEYLLHFALLNNPNKEKKNLNEWDISKNFFDFKDSTKYISFLGYIKKNYLHEASTGEMSQRKLSDFVEMETTTKCSDISRKSSFQLFENKKLASPTSTKEEFLL